LSIEELKFEKKEIKRIIAYILEENDISKHSFSKSGFLYSGKKDFMGTEYLYYMKYI
jgi:L-amino acid N-acyltransferase YncA